MIPEVIYICLIDLQGTEFIIWNSQTSENTVYLQDQVGIKPFRIYISRIEPGWLNPSPLPLITHELRHFLEQRPGSHRKWGVEVVWIRTYLVEYMNKFRESTSVSSNKTNSTSSISVSALDYIEINMGT